MTTNAMQGDGERSFTAGMNDDVLNLMQASALYAAIEHNLPIEVDMSSRNERHILPFVEHVRVVS